MYTLSTFNTEHLQKIVKKLASMLYISVLNGCCEQSRNIFYGNIIFILYESYLMFYVMF